MSQSNPAFLSTALRRNYNTIYGSDLKHIHTDYQDDKFTFITYNGYKHKKDLIKRFNLVNLDQEFNNLQILVSVIMPTFNQGKFIEQAVESILNQTHCRLELIIVNDGSTDNTQEVITRLKQKYQQITVINKPNGGTGSAINEGLKIASGVYTTWVSSDNVYYPNFISTLVDVLETELSVGYVFSGFDWYSVKQDKRQVIKGFSGNVLKEGLYPKKYLKQGYDMGMCFLYRTNILNRVHFYDTRQGEDYLFAVKAAEYCDFYFVDEVLGQYNDHDDTLSRKHPEKTHETEILAKQLAQRFM